jgi:hypothetical protein
MCDPITAAVGAIGSAAASAAGTIGLGTIAMAGVGIAGGVMNAQAQTNAANQRASADMLTAQTRSMNDTLNADALQQSGNNQLLTGQYQQRQMQLRAQALMAKQQAGFASEGVQIDQGTPLDTQIDSARNSDIDQQALEYNTHMKATQSYFAADMNRINAKNDLAAGNIEADADKAQGRAAAQGAIVSSLGQVVGMPTVSKALGGIKLPSF